MILQILIIISISNLISEQKIARDFIHRYLFDPVNYLNYSGYKRFFYDLASCWSCLSFHIGWIFLLVNQIEFGLQYLYTPLIAMMITDVIQKLKR